MPPSDTAYEATAPRLGAVDPTTVDPVADGLEAAISTWRTDGDRRRLRRELLRLVAGLDD